ncbi:MAG: formylmethanofuran dehydrogenase subunit C [Alphaproteobacteria bacterium]|nr:formylmethanofuran dehydrogenase subunit C [Alphaproteobacteria bacterium]
MSTLTLTLRQGAQPVGRMSLAGVLPAKLAGLSEDEISKLPIRVGAGHFALGDFFSVKGTPGDTLVIAGGTHNLDEVGAGLSAGVIVVDGDIGGYGARRMSAGHLEIKGCTGPYLASRLSGGLVTVSGSAGDNVGGIQAGEKFGMTGGVVVVEGDIGTRAGDRMRRGTIVARGKFGDHAGSRMMGGTLWSEAGFGKEPGPLLRRGTLIGPSVEKFLPTFVEGGSHDLVVLGLLSRHVQDALGDLAPKALPRVVHKYSGDMATIGKGEILLFD